jgi:hypothetical protein
MATTAVANQPDSYHDGSSGLPTGRGPDRGGGPPLERQPALVPPEAAAAGVANVPVLGRARGAGRVQWESLGVAG